MFNYTRESEFVTDCYELAYIRCEITVEEYCVFSPDFDNTLDSTTNSISAEKQVFHENRPDIRHQWSISIQSPVQYVPQLDASIHLGLPVLHEQLDY